MLSLTDALKNLFPIIFFHFRHSHNQAVLHASYSRLLEGFDALYKGFTEINPHDFLTIVQITFITADVFAKSLPADCLLKNISDVVEQYPSEIITIIDIDLTIYAEGFPIKRVS